MSGNNIISEHRLDDSLFIDYIQQSVKRDWSVPDFPYTRCILNVWFENASIEYISHWDWSVPKVEEGAVHIDFSATGTFDANTNTFTGIPSEDFETDECTGTMSLKFKEPEADSSNNWLESFDASYDCSPYEVKAVRGTGDIELWQSVDGENHWILGSVKGDAACSVIDNSSIIWKQNAYYEGEWLGSTEYIEHKCLNDEWTIVQVGCTYKKD